MSWLTASKHAPVGCVNRKEEEEVHANLIWHLLSKRVRYESIRLLSFFLSVRVCLDKMFYSCMCSVYTIAAMAETRLLPIHDKLI